MSKLNRSLKKPFQPSVDSYFHHANNANADANDANANEEINSLGLTPKHDSTSIPTLSPAIQSSLLNVGMRVRKSVPEGYKTCAKSLSSSATDAEHRHRAGTEPWHPRTAAARPSELMPYCGILHVGGHETQPVTVENGWAPLEFDPDDESDLMSSQESAIESAITSASIEPLSPSIPCPRNKKRSLEVLNGCLDLTSPLCPIGPTRLSDLNRIRRKLQPKTAVRRNLFETDQEYERIVVDDFEDVTFLRPRD